jgi:tryptophanyl-tRNA synthetase
MTPKRSLSGIQPSGQLHLGNYFGAIRQHVARQDNAFYFIADFHALTTVHDAAALRANVHDVAATYLALGLDPARACMFRQSDVPEVTELTWLLASVTPMGLLERAVSYKDKISKGLPASVGLFLYPALMAADILAYESDVVPVGPDQRQHVEMTQDMAEAFHRAYGDGVFKRPEYQLGTEVSVPGVDGAKMSKSYGNHIPIFAGEKELKNKVMGIKTDSKGVADPKDPETCTVFALYALFATAQQKAEMADRYRRGGLGYGDAKKALLALVDAHFAPARARRQELDAHPERVEETLLAGAQRARAIARQVTDRARRAAGLR